MTELLDRIKNNPEEAKDLWKPITKEQFVNAQKRSFEHSLDYAKKNDYYWNSDIKFDHPYIQSIINKHWDKLLKEDRLPNEFSLMLSDNLFRFFELEHLAREMWFWDDPRPIQYREVGTFTVESGSIRVTDPCYDIKTWCSGQLDNVLNGKYIALIQMMSKSITEWGSRNSVLYIVHEEHKNIDYKTDITEETDVDVGVDSGQAGFFDLGVFIAGKTIDNTLEQKQNEENKLTGGYKRAESPWYDSVCDKTLYTPEMAGVIDGGVCSSSGYGDGGYSCFTKTVDGKIVAAKIVFIREDNEEEKEDDTDE